MATVISLSPDSQKKLCDYVRDAYASSGIAQRRAYMEWMDRQYNRRLDTSARTLEALRAQLRQDPTKFRNMIYPLVMPQVEAAVAYQAEVYCTGVPLFPVVSIPDHAAAAKQLEALTDAHAERGGWGSEFTMVFRDAFKYNTAGALTEWQTIITPNAESTGAERANTTQRQVSWQGNRVKRLDMYNTFFDSRVAPSAVSTDGEFVGTVELMSRTRLRRLIAELPTKLTQNLGTALVRRNSGGLSHHYIPKIGESLYAKAVASEFSWSNYFGLPAFNNGGKQQGNIGDVFEVIRAYVRICPIDFGFRHAAPTLPQVFRVIVVNGDTVVHFEPLITVDSTLPATICQAYEDGLGADTNSLVENVEGMQSLASAFLNSAVAARRRAVADRAIYNQMLIDPKDIASDNPVAKIPMKPSALLNRSAAEAYYAIPFRDEISGNALQEAGVIQQLSYGVSGQNAADQGQFVKGNKTRSEFNTVMSKSASRDRIAALHFETRLFTPCKRQLKFNIIENQGPDVLFSRDNNTQVNIVPQQLREAVMEFKMGDGLTPSAKLADADTLQVMMQTIPAVPQLSMQYDVGKVFMSLLQAGGIAATDYRLSDAQIQYQQALQAWQQAAALAAEKGTPFNTPMPQMPATSQGGQQ